MNTKLIIMSLIIVTHQLSFSAELNCAKEGMSAGGSTPNSLLCCPGLVATNSWTHSHLDDGCNNPPPPGSGGFCVKCGDGRCDFKNFENKCNCPSDCSLKDNNPEKINLPCTFENSGNRRITPDNPKDLICIKTLADLGDVFNQFYLGMWLLNHPGREEDGIKLLLKAARTTDAQLAKSINPKAGSSRISAMRVLSGFYLGSKDTESHDFSGYTEDKLGKKTYMPRKAHKFENVELAYQWFWLWTQKVPPNIFDADKEFSKLLSENKRLELKKSARDLIDYE